MKIEIDAGKDAQIIAFVSVFLYIKPNIPPGKESSPWQRNKNKWKAKSIIRQMK